MNCVEDRRLISHIRKKRYWVGLKTLIENHGFSAKFKKDTMSSYVTIIAQEGSHYWVKTKSGQYCTIDPIEAASGWSLYMEPIKVTPVKCCVWRYLGHQGRIVRYEFYEGMSPWEYFKNDEQKSNIKYWYKCDDEDQTLMVTQ